MIEETERQLRQEHARANADLYLKREAFFDQFRAAYQDPDQAVKKLGVFLEDHGVPATLREMDKTPTTFGAPRGAWWTIDRYAQGGNARAEATGKLLARLPDAARAFGAAQDRERNAWNAYANYCRDHGREPTPPGDPPQVRIPERRDDLSWLKGMKHSPDERPEHERDPDRTRDRER
jgi:hypothetical protein